jgi:hypothetical protein
MFLRLGSKKSRIFDCKQFNPFSMNKKRNLSRIYFLALLCVLSFNHVNAQLSIDAETGIVFTGLNHVRIPGNEGTFVSLSGELNADPKPFARLKAGYRIGKRSEVLLLFAPLRFTYDGPVNRDVFFQGETYLANTPVTASYKFNSYRATYRYYLLERDHLEIGLGLTLKIRDALIGFEGGGLQSEKTDFGFVPLINFIVHWQPTGRFGLLLDGDALAAPQGRAEDVLAAITYRATKNVRLKAGYRILEGGAGNKTVYTFSLFHYGAVGAVLSF